MVPDWNSSVAATRPLMPLLGSEAPGSPWCILVHEALRNDVTKRGLPIRIVSKFLVGSIGPSAAGRG